ncbi:MAG: hypothetical protein WDZ52_07805 [Pseudohongiellaceae bacterium]
MIKSTLFLFVLTVAFCSQIAATQPATYENFIISIPQAAALVEGEPSYYTEVQLQSTIEGNFAVIAAHKSNLVSVDTVVANVTESLPTQVSLAVTGEKSVPCVELQTPAVFRSDLVFTVVLAETTLGPAESCIAIVDPFETTISLDVSGLLSGSYKVNVNGVEASFDL